MAMTWGLVRNTGSQASTPDFLGGDSYTYIPLRSVFINDFSTYPLELNTLACLVFILIPAQWNICNFLTIVK